MPMCGGALGNMHLEFAAGAVASVNSRANAIPSDECRCWAGPSSSGLTDSRNAPPLTCLLLVRPPVHGVGMWTIAVQVLQPH